MTEGKNFYSDRVSGIIRDIESVRRKKWMKIYTLLEKYIKRAQKKKLEINAEICTLLEKYPDTSERDFIQKYAETKIAADSIIITKFAYWITLMIAFLSVGFTILLFFEPEKMKSFKSLYESIAIIYIIAVFIIILYLLFGFKKEPLKDIIIAIEADKLTTQRIDNPKPITDAKTNDNMRI